MARWHPLYRARRFYRGADLSHGPDSGQAGFALVTVLWSIGLISLLGMAVMVGARYRTRTTVSVASYERMAVAAESAVNLAIVRTVATLPGQTFGPPLRCRMPGGESVTVSVEDEAGKVDLNTATPAILTRLFTALTRDPTAGNRIVERIVARRSPAARQGSADQKQAPSQRPQFMTILQLDQIDGVSPQLLRVALPFLTVRSGRPIPDAIAVSPALRELLKLDETASPQTPAPAARELTVRADVAATHGARFIREALVSIGAQNGKPFIIHEWRRGDIHPASTGAQVIDQNGAPLPNCFQIAAGSSSNS
jgi:general secretion pathway protein K